MASQTRQERLDLPSRIGEREIRQVLFRPLHVRSKNALQPVGVPQFVVIKRQVPGGLQQQQLFVDLAQNRQGCAHVFRQGGVITPASAIEHFLCDDLPGAMAVVTDATAKTETIPIVKNTAITAIVQVGTYFPSGLVDGKGLGLVESKHHAA